MGNFINIKLDVTVEFDSKTLGELIPVESIFFLFEIILSVAHRVDIP